MDKIVTMNDGFKIPDKFKLENQATGDSIPPDKLRVKRSSYGRHNLVRKLDFGKLMYSYDESWIEFHKTKQSYYGLNMQL